MFIMFLPPMCDVRVIFLRVTNRKFIFKRVIKSWQYWFMHFCMSNKTIIYDMYIVQYFFIYVN